MEDVEQTEKHYLYASHELATLLKKKGFDEICHAYYWDTEYNEKANKYAHIAPLTGYNHNDFPTRLSRPLYQEIEDWLREKYDIYIWVMPVRDKEEREYIFELDFKTASNLPRSSNSLYLYDTDRKWKDYYKAKEAAFFEILNHRL